MSRLHRSDSIPRCVSRLMAACIVVAMMSDLAAAADPVADFYRGKTIEMIIGAAAGGGYDIPGRALARHMGRHIPGNPAIIVRNMLGATSLIMTNQLYNRSPRDGTVVGMPNNNIPLEPRLRLLAAAGNVAFDVGRFSW